MILLISISAVLLFHAALAYALMTHRINALYFVAAAFIFMAPVSTASLLEHLALFKYGRIYLSVLVVILGILFFRLFRFGPASIAFTAFITYYFFGAFWSDQAFAGILYKGLFGAVFLSGVLMAMGTRNVFDLQVGIRTLVIGGAAFAGFILLELARNPDAISHIGRLYAFGINPNRIGHSSAPMFIIASCIALYDPAKAWRMLGYALMGGLGIIILYTGSRGAVGMALIGSAIVALPMVKRPGLFLTAIAFVTVFSYIGLGLVGEQARARLHELNPEELRGNIWNIAMDYFHEAPIFGQGWVYTTPIHPATQNMHSIYMQVLAELGIVGMTLFLLALAFVCFRILWSWRYVKLFPSCRGYAYLMVGFFAAIFAHGVVESATFVGTTVNAMMLGWSIGLIDRLPALAWQQAQLEEVAEAYEDDELSAAEGEHPLPVY